METLICESGEFFKKLKEMLGHTDQKIMLNYPVGNNLGGDVYIVDSYTEESVITQKNGLSKFADNIHSTNKGQLHMLVSMEHIIKKVGKAINGPCSNN
jgi:hypothetical protein